MEVAVLHIVSDLGVGRAGPTNEPRNVAVVPRINTNVHVVKFGVEEDVRVRPTRNNNSTFYDICSKC